MKLRYNIFFLLLFIASSVSMYAQEIPVDYTKPKKYELGALKVTGVEYLDANVLVNLANVSEGQTITVPGEDIGLIIDRYWKQGLFSDVKVFIDSISGNKIYLNVRLKERPRLNEFTLRGVKKGQEEELKEKIDLRRGSQVTDNVINNAVLVIRKHYKEKGFFNVDVDVRQDYDTIYQNRVNLVFDVDRNNKIKIEDIVFSGNQEFADKRLRRVMKNTKKVDWNIFKGSKYIEKDFKEDRQSLVDFYNEHGYRDAKIVDHKLEEFSDKRIKLYIDLYEGKKYFFGDIEWIGNTKYSDEILAGILGIKKGDVYDRSLLDKRLQIDEDAVSSLYLDNGYLFFNVEPVETRIEGDSINLEMRMYEGQQATINKVIITGNTKTNEHVIRREIRTKPGELFSKSDIVRTVRELASLGHFNPETIQPNPIPNPSDGTVDLEYQLEEKANDQLEISGGYGAGMFVGTIGLRFSNFSARNILNPKAWRPIPTGDGQTLSLRAQTNGRFYQSYNMTFVEPWFGGKKPNSFSFSVFHTKYNSFNSSYYNRYFRGGARAEDFNEDQFMTISGGSIGLGRRLSWPDDFFTLYNELGFQRYRLQDYQSGFARYFAFNTGAANNITLKTTFGRNSQDQLIYPRRGSNFSLTVELTPPYSLFKDDDFYKIEPVENEDAAELAAREEQENALRYNWIEHHKWTFKGSWYTRIIENLVLSTRAEFGLKGYYSANIGHSPFEGFQVGGDGMGYYALMGVETIGLRGYENNSLTPFNPRTGEPYPAANLYNKYTLELRYPFALNPSATIFGLVFVEGGNAWFDLNEFNPFSIYRSAGLGLRAFLPMFGMLGIDWGYGFDPILNAAGVDTGQSKGQFHFTIGQQF